MRIQRKFYTKTELERMTREELIEIVVPMQWEVRDEIAFWENRINVLNREYVLHGQEKGVLQLIKESEQRLQELKAELPEPNPEDPSIADNWPDDAERRAEQ